MSEKMKVAIMLAIFYMVLAIVSLFCPTAKGADQAPRPPQAPPMQGSKALLPCEKPVCDCGCQDGKRCLCSQPVKKVEPQESELHRQWRAEGFAPDAAGVWSKTVTGAGPVGRGLVPVPVTVPRPVLAQPVRGYTQPVQQVQPQAWYRPAFNSGRACST
jgi:hypothetical protein